ncbi:MAG: MmcQ/YjbR family DNA-binding protein [Chitinophagaceae bacterium]
MHIEALREYCLNKPGAEESFPFGESTMVFKVGNKIFLLASLDERKTFNAKSDPDRAVELREMHSEVTPGYHMNKTHWNMVDMEGRLTTKQLQEMIDDSYRLVFGSLSKKLRDEITAL